MKRLSKKYILYFLVLTAIFFAFGTGCFAYATECIHEDTQTVEAKEGSCTEKGYTEGVYCNDCETFISGHVETPYVHSEVPYRKIEPTCIEVGYTEGIFCRLCRIFVSGHEEIPMTDHKTEHREAVEPSCDKVGYTAGQFCTVCETYIVGHEEIPPAHKETRIPKQPETCVKDGYTEGVYCTECNTYISGHEIIPASHKEINVPEQPATCTGNGYTEGIYCTVCNEFLSGHVEIPFIDHDFSEKIVDERHLVQQATAQSPAIYRYDCATCTAISPTLTFTDGDSLPVGATAVIRTAQTSTAIRLVWLPVPGATGYMVFYFHAQRGWRALRDVEGTDTTFTGLANGTVFRFAVRAYSVNSNGERVYSHDFSTVETATKTLAPSKIASKQNKNAIFLAWTPVKGATGYRIYLKSGNSWVVCVNSTVETYQLFSSLPAGRTYQFAVRPYTVYSGGFLLGEYGTYIAATVPDTVKATVTSPAPKHVSLSWTGVSADGYQVYCKVNNGSYKLIRVSATAQKVLYSGLVSGSKLTFAVRAVKRTSGGYVYGAFVPVSVTVR